MKTIKEPNQISPVRILHIFPPNHQQRFSGAMLRWRSYFQLWKEPSVVHYIIDPYQNCMINAEVGFNFEYDSLQKKTSRLERFLWIFKLFISLQTHRTSYDIMHFHVLWWGGLLSIFWGSLQKKTTVYESVLLHADTPGAILKQFLGRLKVWLLKHTDSILAVSEPIATSYLKHGFKEEQIFLLMNCVDTALFSPVTAQNSKILLRQKLGLPEDSTILLFTGSLIWRKGVEILVKGFIKAAAKYPDLFLLLVGPRSRNENPSLDEGYVDNLKSMISEFGMQERVRLSGLIKERERIVEYYAAADIFVFPSRREGLPNVVLEAMASGMPVIASDLPVLKNVIQDGENGLLVPVEDAAAISHAICLVMDNPDFAEKIAQSARAAILNSHSFLSWQEKLVKMYRKISSS